jgi:hypothetical protein
MILQIFVKYFRYIILIIFFFWIILIQIFAIETSNQKFDDELFLICSKPQFYSCEDLEKVFYICVSGIQEFERKGCTYFDNKTILERQIDPRRKN